MKKSALMLQWVLAIGLVAACTTDDEPGVGAQGSKQGYATGKVTDTKGNPIKGVEVVIDNTMFHASYSLGNTDANGNYEIQLPKVGTFMASAQIVKEYNGRRYEMDLAPDVFEAFSIDGAVRNFQWKLTGERPEGEGFFGATIGVNKALYSSIYDEENIEFTLTPVGNLIDGSKGSTLKMKSGKPYSKNYGYLVDIPLGRYEMTAYYNGENGKTPLKLRNHFSEDEYESTLMIDFDPSTMWGRNAFYISYLE
ncbi:carboxypeptidase regulatory-like domain-containing protein [Dyadobacter sp. CY261]|uniref:carboxypeptidase regulatory-like domain-containing protein n=1 Tax=Dyadobacter sp. CY261 TaxID=2907203 RepID=UPI001F44EA53|nr:carboxypeptidase regulatory-like domain-containing protein [Dyadobacter sp. CY261]MCF0071872.1 carboxypeptidase regulatory-like domain-containing protein [Dyadobacter sp. CY261]